jgi:hypothetical protein
VLIILIYCNLFLTSGGNPRATAFKIRSLRIRENQEEIKIFLNAVAHAAPSPPLTSALPRAIMYHDISRRIIERTLPKSPPQEFAAPQKDAPHLF